MFRCARRPCLARVGETRELSITAFPGIDDELFGKIVAFVDRDEARDGSLSPADVLMIRGLIASDPNVRAVVDELRAVNSDLDTFLDDISTADVPHELVTMIQNDATRTRKP